MTRFAMVVVNTGQTDAAVYSRPLMQRYCDRFGMDFVELRETMPDLQGREDGYVYRIFDKFLLGSVMDQYDRVVRLDTDVLISPKAPNIFDQVPEQCLGAVFEDVGVRARRRYAQMELVAGSFGGQAWGTGRYFNSGVVVASRRHREVFRLSEQDRMVIARGDLGGCKEQNLCNWKVRESGFPVHELDFRFNHLSIFSGRWCGLPHRMNSFFIHHAGNQQRKGKRLKRDGLRLLACWDGGGRPAPWWVPGV